MAQTGLVCSKCVGRRTVNNIMIKVNSKVMVTTVPPDQPLAHTSVQFFVSASVHTSYIPYVHVHILVHILPQSQHVYHFQLFLF
jgi:hypothetical protein